MRLARLEEVLSFANGRTSPEREDAAPFPVFGSNGLIGQASESNSPPNTIVIGRVGSYCGSVHFSREACWVTDNAIRATAKGENDPSFLHYLLKQLNLNNWRSGSGQPLINQTTLNAIETQIPCPREQRAISGIVGALDDRITLLRETNATLETIAQALFKSWFVDFDPVRAKMEGRTPEGMDEATAALFPDGFETSELGEVPKGWRVSRLADVTERITKGTTPTTLKRAFVPSGINFVKAESMTGDGGFIAEKFAFIDSETHALLARSQLQDGDVLISIAGTIGRLAVMTEDFLPANTNQAVALIRPNPDLLPSGLIYRLLRRNESQQKLAEKVVQAVQANLSLGTLSDLKLVVPPPSVVGRIFGAGLEQIDLIRVANDQRIRTLSTLRDTLLPRLISGQLRLPEAQAALESTP